MKYLKKFNEDLSPRLLRRASRKLSQLGHKRRSKEMEDYAKETEEKAELINWEKNVNEFSKFGKVKLNFDAIDKKGIAKHKKTGHLFSGDFYLCMILNAEYADDGIAFDKEENKNNFKCPIAFSIGAIPVDKETIDKCKALPDPEFGNGFYWVMWLNIDYKVENGEMKFDGFSIMNYDESVSGEVSLADRKSAVVLKNMLKTIFENKVEYPSGYTDITNMYDKIQKIYCQDLELGIDYNFTMDKVQKDINNTPINNLYKD